MFSTLTSIYQPLTLGKFTDLQKIDKKKKKSALRRNYIEGNVISPLGAPLIKLSTLSANPFNFGFQCTEFYFTRWKQSQQKSYWILCRDLTALWENLSFSKEPLLGVKPRKNVFLSEIVSKHGLNGPYSISFYSSEHCL